MRFTADNSILLGDITPAFTSPEQWAIRWDVAWYVDLCERHGFAGTSDKRLECARRYLAGKRRVSAPGTKRKKREAARVRKLMNNIPPELIDAVKQACLSPAAEQYRSGNDKAFNSLVGMVMKKYKTEVSVIMNVLTKELNNGTI